MTAETIAWKPVAELPDSDTTVLLFDPAASEPVWLGYLDGDTWRFVDGMPAAPAYWAKMPQGVGPDLLVGLQ
jgi:hypothetical protein